MPADLTAVVRGVWARFGSRFHRACALAALAAAVATCTAEHATGPVSTPTKVAFLNEPNNVQAGLAISPALQVQALDAAGKPVPTFTGTVTLAIASGTGTSGASLSGTMAVAAISGVATFADVSIDKTGSGYVLSAASGSLTPGSSTPFTVAPGPLARLIVDVPPATTAGTSFAPPIVVTATDAPGNTVTTFNGAVALTIGTNPAGGALSGMTTVAAVAGVATFPGLSIDKAASGYTVTASVGGVSSTSGAFTITPAAATQLRFSTQPVTTAAGTTMTPAVVVTAEDPFHNTASGFSNAVTLSLTSGSGTAGATVSGAAVPAAAGVATFSGLSVDSVGSGYTLLAAAAGLSSATSTAFNIVPGTAAALVFTGQPAATTAGATMSPVVVTARDAKGNTATGFAGQVKLAISAGTGAPGAKLSNMDTVTATATNGIASFANLSINKSGSGYRLSATTAGPTGTTSNTFTITAGAASQLVFAVQPHNTAAGAFIAPDIEVTAQDALGNTDPTFTDNVTVAIGTNAGTPPGTLSGATLSKSATNGVVTFADLSIDKVGNSYTLSASTTAAGVSAATSDPFNIFANTATHLVFTAPPGNATAGPPAQLATITVTALDGSDNVVPLFEGAVTLSITSGTGTLGATLAGTKTVNAVSGVAGFSDLSIDKAGIGYRLDAMASGLTGATSTTFAITPAAATHLAFSVGPSTATAGALITPSVAVAALDAQGNIDTSFAGSVTVAIGANPSNGTLRGAQVVAPAAGTGVASFSDLNIRESGVEYSLTAAATGLTGATSGTFDIVADVATEILFTSQPTTTTAGHAIPVEVTARDTYGNVASGFSGPTSSVTVAITALSGTANAALLGTSTVDAALGVATFPDLKIDSAGNNYTLTATTTALTPTISDPFGITPGAATQLAFTQQPGNATAGPPSTIPTVKVTARDSLGNTDTSFTGAITLAITNNAGTAGAHLANATANATAGIATFATLSIDSAGADYTLSASATNGLAGGPSSSFTIDAGTVSQLVITGQPTSVAAGAAIPVQVTARDALGNTATGFASPVTLEITTGTGTPEAHLLNATATAAGGIAIFTALSIDSAGIGYRINAKDPFVSAASNAFNITPGPADHLAFTANPSQTSVGATISPAVKVTVQDAFGNIVPSFVNNVTVAISPGTGDPTATLSGSLTRAAVNGVATFSTLSIDKETGANPQYTLNASALGLATGTSQAFDIIASVADHLFFSVQPSNATAKPSTLPTVEVIVMDASGQTVTGFGGDVTMAIAPLTGTPGAVLEGTVTKTAVAGVATFNDLTIDKAGTGYYLTASAVGGPPPAAATSKFFSIAAGPATALFFTVQPSLAQIGQPITPQVEVTARDVNGNTATGFADSVAVAIGNNPSGGALTGTLKKAAVGGVATFSNLSINLSGTGYTLTGTAPTLTEGTSADFDIQSTEPDQLAFTAQPTATTAGAIINNATGGVKVTVLTNGGVPDAGFVGNVTLTITGGTGTRGATLSGTTTQPVVSGIATFDDLTINFSGSGYRLSATTSGAAGATSTSFAINPGAATKVEFTVQPAATTAGTPIPGLTGPSIQVTVRDALGNTVPTFAGEVTITLAANPFGGTLAGTLSATIANGHLVTGVATFADLSIARSGDPYNLIAAATGLTSDTSNAISIAGGPATHLVFTVQPSTRRAGFNISPSVRVAALDAYDNVATGFDDDVTLVITPNTGTSGAVLSGGTVAASNGVATFSALNVDKVGTGYTLTASTASAGVTEATSVPFDITPGPATHLVFTMQPSTTAAGATITPAVMVEVRDAFENVVTNYTNNITIDVGSGAGGTLTGTKTASVVNGHLVNGVATFNDLKIGPDTGTYTLKATSIPGITLEVTSDPFDIT